MMKTSKMSSRSSSSPAATGKIGGWQGLGHPDRHSGGACAPANAGRDANFNAGTLQNGVTRSRTRLDELKGRSEPCRAGPSA